MSASITGVVTDATGAALSGVEVSATNIGTDAIRRTVTNPRGHYILLQLPVGSYDVRMEKAGFKSELRRGVSLAVGQEIVLNERLSLGKVRQRITVSGEAPLLSATTNQTSGLVGERQIKNLPLNGRSYDELLTLNPGIVNYTSEKTGGIGVSNSSVANMFAVSGRRPQENLFLLDGIEYTGVAEINLQPGGTSGQLLGVDAIREFNVLTDTYGAEYGKRPGAQVIMVTQSGTNGVHGDVYEFLRNSSFDARNFFDRGPIPPFERNQFGGSLGGPTQRNKTFLFGNYEGFRQKLGLSAVTLVPDNNARHGLLPGPRGTLTNVGLAPGVQPLLSLWPVQNGPDLGSGIAEAFSHPLQNIREDFGTTRLDRIFSQRDSLTGVYTIDDSADRTPTANPISVDLESLREQVLSIEETHVLSPTMLNSAGFGFSRASYFYTGGTTASVPGFVAGNPVGAVVIGGSATPNSPSQITLAGSNIGSHLFATRNLFTYADTLSALKGGHELSSGLWFEGIQANDTLALGQYGQTNFSSLSNFLEGKVATFSAVLSPTPLGWRSLEGAGFVQDSMRLRPNLALTVGFRSEFTNGWNEAHGRASNYVFDSRGVIETNPRVGDSAFTVNNAKFLPEPRVGLAWDPWGRGKTVIHAGFGIYAHLQDGLSYRLDQNAPFNTTITLKDTPLSSFPITPGEALPGGGLIQPGGVQPDLQTPTVEAYTFKIDQQLTPNTLFSIGYVGSHAYHEILSVDANEPLPTVCTAATCPAALPAGTIYYPPGAPLANPGLANTWTWFSEGTSSYNALQVDVRRRFNHGLDFRGVYTWSKSLDNGDTLNGSAAANAPGLVMDPRNLALDWGLSTFDVRNAAVFNGGYEMPFGRGKAFLSSLGGWPGKLVSGWSLNGIVTLQSGFPFTPQLGFNPSNTGDTRNPDRPSWNPAFTGPVISGSPDRYFNPDAFVVPPNGTYGDVGRDTLIGPGVRNVDVSLMKDTTLSEKLRIQFRAEFFNICNTPNFNTPNLIVFTSALGVPSSAAGVITSTSTSARQIQFGLKLIW
ncbi:MAG TPA: carboxypeptidase-like regulatory domain-containing protein [Terriglobia bacterium]|nr:carboxypeptidase-like regulatory domain-containing protein [Terriglobia bacterium]